MSVPEGTEMTQNLYAETLLGEAPRCYMRINITKNTKGYSYETTVSAETDDPAMTGDLAKSLLGDADLIARSEIVRRGERDSGEL